MTQACLTLSSAEAELVAAFRVASESIGCQSILLDLGVHSKINLGMDSSAAMAMLNRDGVGKIKASACGAHRQRQALSLGYAESDVVGKAAGLRAEHQRVTALERAVAVSPAMFGREHESALRRDGLNERIHAGVAGYHDRVGIVQACAPESAVVNRKTNRLN